MQSSHTPPVIIIGMRRSGTSIVTRLLQRVGLFVGRTSQSNDEAVFFLHLNKWILEHCGRSSEQPTLIHELLKDWELRSSVEEYRNFSLSTPQSVSYLGLRLYLKHRSIKNLDGPWGWKVPRNALTLPIWLSIFPDAKVVHIQRHGVDVAQSLAVRRNATTGPQGAVREAQTRAPLCGKVRRLCRFHEMQGP